MNWARLRIIALHVNFKSSASFQAALSTFPPSPLSPLLPLLMFSIIYDVLSDFKHKVLFVAVVGVAAKHRARLPPAPSAVDMCVEVD